MIVHFSAHISKWDLVCKFGVIFHISIISCLCSRFHVRNQWFFYSVITFSYTKCFVHSYTVDVVFTLSYQRTNFILDTHSTEYIYVQCLKINQHYDIMWECNLQTNEYDLHAIMYRSFAHIIEWKHDDVIKWKHFPRCWPFVRWIHRTKTSDAELWCFLWSALEWTIEKTIMRLVIWDAFALIMTSQ